MGDGHLVQHTPCDNIESLFYILLEFTVMYLGPKGVLAPRPSKEALRRDTIRRWGLAYENMTRNGLVTSSMWKWEFIHGLTDPPLITPYFIPCHSLLEEWCQAISFASTQSTTLSHDKICDILTRGLSMISQQLAQILPPTPPSALDSTIALSPPPTSTSQPVATITMPLPDPPLAVRRSHCSRQVPGKP
jgi:hypothetical protein